MGTRFLTHAHVQSKHDYEIVPTLKLCYPQKSIYSRVAVLPGCRIQSFSDAAMYTWTNNRSRFSAGDHSSKVLRMGTCGPLRRGRPQTIKRRNPHRFPELHLRTIIDSVEQSRGPQISRLLPQRKLAPTLKASLPRLSSKAFRCTGAISI